MDYFELAKGLVRGSIERGLQRPLCAFCGHPGGEDQVVWHLSCCDKCYQMIADDMEGQ